MRTVLNYMVVVGMGIGVYITGIRPMVVPSTASTARYEQIALLRLEFMVCGITMVLVASLCIALHRVYAWYCRTYRTPHTYPPYPLDRDFWSMVDSGTTPQLALELEDQDQEIYISRYCMGEFEDNNN